MPTRLYCRLQVSSKTGAGVPTAVAAIRRERRGRDVYVMGAANVGKSAFIRALVK
jgi:nitric-oxide synthase